MMKAMTFYLISLSTIAVLNSQALAEGFPRTYPLEGCVPTGSGKTLCTFPTATLYAQPYTFAMRWEVDYSFPCKSNRHGIVLSNRQSSKAVGFANQHIIEALEGVGPLELKDSNPSTTRGAVFVGECSITIHSVVASPTIEVLIDWKDEAREIIGNIKDARDGLLLAESFTSLASVLSGDLKGLSSAIWNMMHQVLVDMDALGIASLPLGICEFTDATCTKLLGRDKMSPEQIEKLDIVLSESPYFADYHRLYAHINALPIVIEGHEKNIEEVFGIVKADLTKFFRTKLERQRNSGRKFLARAKPFVDTFKDELRKNVQELDALIKGSAS